MPALVPVLLGTAGLVDGERYVLSDDADLVVGRSRSCDISLRRVAAYLKAPPATRDNDHDFNTVSRRHLRLSLRGDAVTLQDLSTNGTFYNEEPLREARTITLAIGVKHVIRLGTRETLSLELLPVEDERIKELKPVVPGQAAGAGD
jgi:pSer/pThr/pTyr-binding forkhead associated (FHA) protein